jgi:hypothetical protein
MYGCKERWFGFSSDCLELIKMNISFFFFFNLVADQAQFSLNVGERTFKTFDIVRDDDGNWIRPF